MRPHLQSPLFGAPRPDKRRKQCALVLVFLAGLVYIARQCCVVIDCLLTVFHDVQVTCRRCSSCIYTTSGDAAHGPRSSVDAAHGPGGYAAAAALFLGGEEQQHGQMALEKCIAQASTSKIAMVRA